MSYPDVSFLLPTNRSIEHADRVIESINRIDTDLTYEICVYTQSEILMPNVRHFDEKEARPYGRYLITLYLTIENYHFVYQICEKNPYLTINGGYKCCPYLSGA